MVRWLNVDDLYSLGIMFESFNHEPLILEEDDVYSRNSEVDDLCQRIVNELEREAIGIDALAQMVVDELENDIYGPALQDLETGHFLEELHQ